MLGDEANKLKNNLTESAGEKQKRKGITPCTPRRLADTGDAEK
jgi:hypothetical protein